MIALKPAKFTRVNVKFSCKDAGQAGVIDNKNINRLKTTFPKAVTGVVPKAAKPGLLTKPSDIWQPLPIDYPIAAE